MGAFALVRRFVAKARGSAGLVEPTVWLDPHQAPTSPFEESVFQALAGGPLPLPALVERLASASVKDLAGQGAWSLDVGAEALPALRIDVARQLRTLDGRLLAIARTPSGSERGSTPTVVGYRLPGRAPARRRLAYAVAYAAD